MLRSSLVRGLTAGPRVAARDQHHRQSSRELPFFICRSFYGFGSGNDDNSNAKKLHQEVCFTNHLPIDG